ncbi:hypothetical protein I552_0494 [Mycobacterium xenopi 3993]|nr:hypothetical protein I552_0494 [Mycobacterium xenopi 3993]
MSWARRCGMSTVGAGQAAATCATNRADSRVVCYHRRWGRV